MRACATLMVLATCCAVPAFADTLPSFLNSNDTDRNLPAPNLPADAFRPVTPALQLPTPAGSNQPLLMGTKVHVRHVRIEGGTVYPLEQLASLYQPLVGHEASLAQLIEATRTLTRRYQDDGYLLSYAYLPPQSFDKGVVRVVLVEGYIRDYELHGNIGRVSAYLDKLVAKLKVERPLTRKTFERYTTLMSRVPGLTLEARVPPPGTTDGATTLIAQASRKSITSTMSLTDDNRDSTQALLGVSSNAQTALAEQVTVSGLFPPGDDQEHYYRLDYSQFLGSEGVQLGLSAARYRSDPRADVLLDNGLSLKPHRENDRYSIGLTYPLIAAPDQLLNLGARFYAVNDRTDYQVVGYPLQVSTHADIRALAFEGDWRQSTATRLRIVSAGVYKGIDGLGANTNAQDYDLGFLRWRLSGVQSDRFWNNWQAVASAAAYGSRDTLPDSERAVFGGQNFGRGYPSDQSSGDTGWGAAYELNYSFKRDGTWVKVLQPYGVLDRARTWFNQLPVKDSELASAALGVRFGDAHYYNLSLEAAKPMADKALDSLNRQVRYTLSFSYQL